jgi:hypothetical protein
MEISNKILLGYCDVSYSSIRATIEVGKEYEKKYKYKKEEIKLKDFFTKKDEEKEGEFNYKQEKIPKLEMTTFYNEEESPVLTIINVNYEIKDEYVLHFVKEIFEIIEKTESIEITIPASVDINTKQDFFIHESQNPKEEEEEIIIKDNFLNHIIYFSKLKGIHLKLFLKKGKKINKYFKNNNDDGTEEVIFFLKFRILCF